MRNEMIASRISEFYEVRGDRYDERRESPYWGPILTRWRETYERDKSNGRYSFSECLRNANIEAITTVLERCEAETAA